MKDRLIIAITWVCIIGLCLAFWGVVLTAAFGQNVNSQTVVAHVADCKLRLSLVSMQPETVKQSHEQDCNMPLGKLVVE